MQLKHLARVLRRLWPDAVRQDVLYAGRRLAREPGFAATAILTLAVGIGASTAMFSTVQAVLWRPLGIAAPQRIVMMWGENTRQHSVGELTYQAYRDLRARMRSFEDVAIVGSTNWGGEVTIGREKPFSVPCAVVSGTFFDLLGARPLLGRTLRQEDDEPSARRVLVLSHRMWTQYFNRDPNVIGHTVRVREEAPAEVFEIVGVMPSEFFFPRGAEYWTPAAPRLASIARHQPKQMVEMFDGLGVFYGLGRLTTSATVGSTRAEAALFIKAQGEQFKVDLSGVRIAVTPILDHIFGQARRALLVLLGAVLAILLIACINVAGLLFARGTSRMREMAVRAALGAGRRVLVRQLLTESAVVAAAGTIIGVSVAALALDALIALSPADIPRLDTTTLDSRVLLFAVVIAAATTLVVGLAPARHLSRPSLVDDLKGSVTGMAGRSGRTRMGRVLAALQVAATLMLLMAAGLCMRSFDRLADLDLGFDSSHVLTFSIGGLDEIRYPARAQRYAAVEALLARIERAPHVVAAGAIFQRPFEHGPIGMDSGFLLEGQPDTPQSWSRNPMLNWEAVTAGYFGSMGIRLVRGRMFNQSDTEDSPPVIIVSERLAAAVWPGQDPLGKRLRDSFSSAEQDPKAPRWQTVVGVVATARYREIESPRLDLYLPLRQSPSDVQHFTVRATIDPLEVAPTVGAEIAGFDKALTMSGVTTMEAIVRRTRGPWRFTMLVFSVFGAVAVMLSAMGLFGLVAYGVNQRTREISVRMALGAERRSVVRLMVSQHGLEPAVAGLMVGLIASLFATRLLSGLLFGISPTDPATFAGVFALLAVVAVLASYVPARRAASVDPLAALRNE